MRRGFWVWAHTCWAAWCAAACWACCWCLLLCLLRLGLLYLLVLRCLHLGHLPLQMHIAQQDKHGVLEGIASCSEQL